MTISQPRGLALESIAEVDPELWEAMQGERRRQHDKIELIASENYVSAAVMEAQGSWLTNKYAEGLPGKRYYGGCEYVDVAETPRPGARPGALPGRRARQRPAALGRAGQHGRLLQRPRAGRPDPGHEPGPRRPPDPRHGAQLQRQAVRGPRLRRPPGHRAHRLRRAWRRRRARSGRSSSSPARAPTRGSWDFERMAAIAHGVGALLFVDMAHIAGLVAAGVHPSPFPHADIVTTTTHKTLRGPRGGLIFAATSCPTASTRRTSRRSRASLARRSTRRSSPGVQGGPLMHVIAGKAVAFKLAAERAVPGGPAPHDRERRGPRRDARRPGRAGRVGRHGQPPDARRRDAARASPARRPSTSSTRSASPSTRTRSRSTRCRRTRRRASASGTPATTSRGFGDGRDARRSAGSSSRRSAPATTTPPSRRAWRPRSREIVRPLPGPGAARA